MPKVSILIPTYNSAEFIEETLQSALSQTYENYEIVIVDNASTDNTWELLCAFRDKHPGVRVYRNDSNIGPIKNWMRCIDNARGEYGKILWSDDLLKPSFLEKTVPVLESRKDVAFVYTPAVIFDENGRGKIFYNYITRSGYYNTSFFIKGILYDKDFPNSPACALFRLTDLKKNLMLTIPNRFDSDASQHAIGNDLLIFLLTAKDYKNFCYIDEPLALFRIHPNSITIGSKKKKLVLNYDIAKSYFVDSFVSDVADIKRFNSILWLHHVVYGTTPAVSSMYYNNTCFDKDYLFLIGNLINPRVYMKRLFRKFFSFISL